MSSPIVEGFLKALHLITVLDPTLIEITVRSMFISGLATIIASSWSLPLGTFIGLKDFKGKNVVKGVFNSLLGIPTVTLGLVLYLLFSRAGPLGFLHLLYTPWAIIVGQSILISPIIISIVVNALEAVDPDLRRLTLTLGASEAQSNITVLEESLGGIILAIKSGFNRSIAELGVALMLGGNIRGVTRVLTTTIALETTRGELALSIALTTVLMLVVLGVNALLSLVRRLQGYD